MIEISTRPVAIAGAAVQTVNARDLHSSLLIGKDFSNWIKAQILRARLIENRDFVTVAQKGVGGKFDSTEYFLTIEAAKHIAMLSNTDRGFEVREYFIACERKATTINSPAQVLVAMAQQFLQVEQEQRRQSAEISQIQETVAVLEARTQPENKHFTVMGYANLIGKRIDLGAASKLGRQCANLSRESGLPIGDVSDPRFGKVHSYHESVLQAVMASGA